MQQPRAKPPTPGRILENQLDTYHANIISIPTFHFFAHVKAHSLIDSHIWDTLRALKIALHALTICLFRDGLKEHPPNTFSLCLGANCNDITEIVPTRIIPDSSLCLGLSLLPDPIPIRAKSAAAEILDVVEKLIKG